MTLISILNKQKGTNIPFLFTLSQSCISILPKNVNLTQNYCSIRYNHLNMFLILFILVFSSCGPFAPFPPVITSKPTDPASWPDQLPTSFGNNERTTGKFILQKKKKILLSAVRSLHLSVPLCFLKVK